ncbi:hypothetical protein RHGRI_038039 [Rhododendron griersonianum]|uniref:ABC transporter domain-containing protein n=1 Tax=Rhododendron griersonianum TaxID=479676 RepID=A0AAV6HU57_9ERIC|nr:hypothetical protein RHGRI_038039 [Rhododendron griersonianum]
MEIEAASASYGGGGDVENGVQRFNGGDRVPAFLVWEDLTVVLPKNGTTRRLLSGLTGYAEPGRIMAIMGPSGSGKSTLLDCLAGRLSRNVVMTGNILLNGKKRRLGYGVVAYVTQDDILLGTLTVRETITYSAYLRLPSTMSKEEVQDIVEGTIMEMGLQECSDRLIGNWHLRGISGGEKKRVSIALEILTRPNLLFLDEPTSGLDSASAFFVIQTLRNVARDGRTVVSSIHQPSSEVFALFDDLFLLSGGESIYFGEAKRAVQEFPTPSDPLTNLATVQIKGMLIEKYRRSEYAAKARARVRELSTIQTHEVETKTGSQAGWWMQLSTLIRRSSLNMSRDVGYYWLRLIIYILVSFGVGTIYFDVGTSYTAILARGACGAFISGFMTFMSIGGFPSFIEEMKGIMMMTAGFFRLLDDLPKPFWRYPVSYISYGAWALQGAYKNDLLGLEFDPMVPGDPKLKGLPSSLFSRSRRELRRGFGLSTQREIFTVSASGLRSGKGRLFLP